MLTLQSSASTIDIDLPIRPYKTMHRLSIDIGKLSNNTYESFDNGASLDTTSCECTFQLPLDQALSLQTFIRTYRGESFTMAMDATSGFYPFLPNRGNVGPFLVAAEIKKFKGFQEDPYRYFDVDMKLTNVGSWPSYSLPSEQWEGDVSFAGVNNLRYSPYEPDADPVRRVAFDEKTNPYYTNQPADQGIVKLHLQMNRSKAAAVMNALINTVRASDTVLTVPFQHFPFGEFYEDDGMFGVLMIQDSIEVEHQELNEFSCDIYLWLQERKTGLLYKESTYQLLYKESTNQLLHKR